MSTYAGTCGQKTGETDGGAQDALFSEVFDVQCLANCSVMVTEPGTGRVRLILDSEQCPAPATPPGIAPTDPQAKALFAGQNLHFLWLHCAAASVAKVGLAV